MIPNPLATRVYESPSQVSPASSPILHGPEGQTFLGSLPISRFRSNVVKFATGNAFRTAENPICTLQVPAELYWRKFYAYILLDGWPWDGRLALRFMYRSSEAERIEFPWGTFGEDSSFTTLPTRFCPPFTARRFGNDIVSNADLAESGAGTDAWITRHNFIGQQPYFCYVVTCFPIKFCMAFDEVRLERVLDYSGGSSADFAAVGLACWSSNIPG
jgi:hypothetical protein